MEKPSQLSSADIEPHTTGHHFHWDYDRPDTLGRIQVWVEMGKNDELASHHPHDLARVCRLLHNGRMRVTVYRNFPQRKGIIEDVVGTRVVRETGEIVIWKPVMP